MEYDRNVANQYAGNKLLKEDSFWELTESQLYHAALIQRTVSLMLMIGKYLNLNNGSFQHANLQTKLFPMLLIYLFHHSIFSHCLKNSSLGKYYNPAVLHTYTLRESPAKYCRIPLLTLHLPELYIWRFEWLN